MASSRYQALPPPEVGRFRAFWVVVSAALVQKAAAPVLTFGLRVPGLGFKAVGV